MKTLQFSLLALLAIYSSTSFSQLINTNLSISTPTTVTGNIEIIADFGIPGQNIFINSTFIDFSFGYNPLSEGESLGIAWLVDPALRRERRIILGQGTDKYSISTALSNTLLVNNSGLAYFNIYVSGGNGVNLTDITLTVDATVQPVPLPSSIVLFLSGLLILSRKFLPNKKT